MPPPRTMEVNEQGVIAPNSLQSPNKHMHKSNVGVNKHGLCSVTLVLETTKMDDEAGFLFASALAISVGGSKVGCFANRVRGRI